MSATTTLERTALKEWAVLCDAMARGDIIAMVRKGGIREQRAGFTVRHDRFVLYPTYFHERESELAPRFRLTLARSRADLPPAGVIRISLVADVAAVWHVRDLEPLRAIEGEHGLVWDAVESRFNYRGVTGVHVVAARISRLSAPVDVPEARRYQGCVSWVELDADIDVSSAAAIIDDANFEARIARLRDALGEAVA
ncbi:MAG TPA: DUF1802 family protein [Gemmatimonadaceae bacterium]|nr:DUF1802 family protein [Gemmatimonadaceae bacterium]